MNILGIETSCDESAAAVVRDGRKILSSVVASQISHHRPYFGVVPEIASRIHTEQINKVIAMALKKSGLSLRRGIDAIGVTVGPGLVGSLLVGRMTAEALGWIYRRPVLAVNHVEGHLLSAILTDPSLRPPFVGLVVSGGHTELIHVKNWGDYQLIGRTRDDAAGEAFDKVAKMLHLGYPGGPIIDRLAENIDPHRISFPRAWLAGTWDFSFSGLKTAVLYKLREKKKWPRTQIQALCSGFQAAVVDVLVGKTMAASQVMNMETIVVGGGVASNRTLRASLSKAAKKTGRRLVIAPPSLCTDNAAMIASAAFFNLCNPRRKRIPLRVTSQWQIPPLSQRLPPFFPKLLEI